MTNNHKINYIELPMRDAARVKAFYGGAFGWAFTDWGERYISFDGAGIDGGFNGFEEEATPQSPGILVVLYADDLTQTRDTVVAHGGQIIKDIYDFPGGQRFHFRDPEGNELAVWSPPPETKN